MTTHWFTKLPLTDDGWTDLEKIVQSDARIVYVSTSGDNATGVVYSPASAEVGSNPFEPSGSILPFATFDSAYSELRDGYPDMLLMKRGDTWSSFPYTNLVKSGESKTKRSIIGAYGTIGNRPLLQTENGCFYTSNTGADNIIITDLELTQINRSGTVRGNTAVSVQGDGKDILLEGNYIHNYTNGVVLQSNDALGNPVISDIALRRNIIAFQWDGTTHCVGIYIYHISGLLLEENVWDHNGWDETYQPQNTHSRNIYLGNYDGLVIRGEVNARSSSEGAQIRYGGTFEKNLSLQNTSAVQIGHPQTKTEVTGIIQYNVVLDARDIETSPRGFGMEAGNRAKDVLFYDNIIAHQYTGTGNIYAFFVSNNDEMTYQDPVECPTPCKVITTNPKFINNIVYDWDKNGSLPGRTVLLGQSTKGVTIQDNSFQQTDGGGQVSYITGNYNSGPDSSWILNDNTYYSNGNTTPFKDNRTFSEWVIHVSETGSQDSQITYTDPDRDIESYMTSLGYSPTDYEDALDMFLTEARKQSRYNWREDYTAYVVINYIREGFDRAAIEADYIGEDKTVTFHAPGSFNGSPNKYEAPDVAALKTADATQDLAGTGPVLYDGFGNAVAFSEDSIIDDGVANNNKQLYACFADSGNRGIAQYSAENSDNNSATIKAWFGCWNQDAVTFNGESVTEDGETVTYLEEN